MQTIARVPTQGTHHFSKALDDGTRRHHDAMICECDFCEQLIQDEGHYALSASLAKKTSKAESGFRNNDGCGLSYTGIKGSSRSVVTAIHLIRTITPAT